MQGYFFKLRNSLSPWHSMWSNALHITCVLSTSSYFCPPNCVKIRTAFERYLNLVVVHKFPFLLTMALQNSLLKIFHQWIHRNCRGESLLSTLFAALYRNKFLFNLATRCVPLSNRTPTLLQLSCFPSGPEAHHTQWVRRVYWRESSCWFLGRARL